MFDRIISKHTLTLCSWNAGCLELKLGELIHFLDTHNIDIALIQGTFFTPQHKLKLHNYTVYRQDRPIANGRDFGGVAILVRNSVQHHQVHIPQTNAETVAIKLSDNTHIIGIYNPPTNTHNAQQLHTLLDVGNKVLLVGDFNARHTSWGCHVNNASGRNLYRYTLAHIPIIMNTNPPTHYPFNNSTTLDFILNKNVNGVVSTEAPHELGSDDDPIVFQLNARVGSGDDTRYVTTYKDTTWADFRKTLDTRITITPLTHI